MFAHQLAHGKLILLIIGLVFLVYLPFVNSPFIWDDEQFIYRNLYVQAFDFSKILSTNTIAGAGVTSNYYRPVTTLTFALDHLFWGFNPVGFNLSNALFHSGSAVALYILLYLLLRSKTASLVISIFFAVHPLQTEAVSYINSRGDSLYALFGLLGAICLALILNKRPIVRQWYDLKIIINYYWQSIGVVGFLILSILSKEIGMAILGLYLLIFIYYLINDLYFNHKPILQLTSQHKFALKSIIISASLFILYLFFRYYILQFDESLNLFDSEDPYGQFVLVRLATFFKVFWIYLGLILLPFNLHMERTTDIVLSVFSIWGVAFFLALILWLWLAYKELKLIKKARIFLGGCWFGIMIFPISGLIPVNDILYEHWLYLPKVGFWIVILGLFGLIPSIFPISRQKLQIWSKRLIVILIFVWIILSWRQNWIWSDHVRFYEYTLSFNQTARVHNNLAMAYAERGNFEQAIINYESAIAINPNYPQTYNNLGNVYLELEDWNTAQAFFEKAIQLSPLFFQSRIGLIASLINLKEFSRAHLVIDEMRDLGYEESLLNSLLMELEKLEEQ